MTVFIWISGIQLTIAAFATLYRVLLGPTLLDRVLAIDVLLAILVAALCLIMVARDTYYFVLVLLALSMVGFVGSVTVARYADNSPSDEKKSKPQRKKLTSRKKGTGSGVAAKNTLRKKAKKGANL